MSFTERMKQAGLLEAFVSAARAGASDSALREWAALQPALRDHPRPASFRDLRRQLDCSAPRGGKRENRGQPLHEVVGRRESNGGIGRGGRQPRP